jgi:hypothetical protein
LKIVLDESVSRDVATALRAAGCSVAPFPNRWKGTKNGQLLSKIREAGYDCLLTCDKNLAYQQNLTKSPILIAVLPTQRVAVLLQHIEDMARVLASPDLPTTGAFVVRFETPSSRA